MLYLLSGSDNLREYDENYKETKRGNHQESNKIATDIFMLGFIRQHRGRSWCVLQ